MQVNRFEHGGDTYGLGDVLDFSASLNPLGMPEAAVQALREGAAGFDAYPDPSSRDLTHGIARAHGVDSRQVVVTAGASDAFARIVQVTRPRAALVCAPCYSGYEQALALSQAKVARHELRADEQFDVTERIASDFSHAIDLAFLCSPHNPTGRLVERAVLEAALNAAERCEALMVVDECFLPLAGGRSAIDLLGRFPQLVVVRAFTKTYAMAGLRLGYCVCARADLACDLRSAGLPWAVSAPAQAAGRAALDADGFLEESRTYVAAERARLQAALAALDVRTVPSAANFVLFQGPAGLRERLLERGMLIRSCGNFHGLDDTWYRVGLRAAADNERLIRALKEVLA